MKRKKLPALAVLLGSCVLTAGAVTAQPKVICGSSCGQGAPANVSPTTTPSKTAPTKTRSVNMRRLPQWLRGTSRQARASRLSQRAYALSRQNTLASKRQALRHYLQACRLGRKQACDNARLIRSWIADHRGKRFLESGRFDRALKQFRRSLVLIPPAYPAHQRVAWYNIRRAEAMAQEARRHNWKPRR